MRLRQGFYLRLALIADLWIYIITLVLFVLLPFFPIEIGARLDGNEITDFEFFLAATSIIPFTTLFGRLVEKPNIPLNRWAYLITAFYGLFVLVGFLTVGVQSVIVEDTVKVIVVSVSFIGIAGAAGAHILDGGDSFPLGPRLERYLEEKDD